VKNMETLVISKEFECEMCEEKSSTRECVTCDKVYCHDCSQKHHEKKGHEISHFVSSTKCFEHKEKKMIFSVKIVFLQFV